MNDIELRELLQKEASDMERVFRGHQDRVPDLSLSARLRVWITQNWKTYRRTTFVAILSLFAILVVFSTLTSTVSGGVFIMPLVLVLLGAAAVLSLE